MSHFHGPIFAMEQSPAFSLMKETNHVLCDHTHTALITGHTHKTAGRKGEEMKMEEEGWRDGGHEKESERGWRGKEALCSHNASVCGLKLVLCFERLPTRRELT